MGPILPLVQRSPSCPVGNPSLPNHLFQHAPYSRRADGARGRARRVLHVASRPRPVDGRRRHQPASRTVHHRVQYVVRSTRVVFRQNAKAARKTLPAYHAVSVGQLLLSSDREERARKQSAEYAVFRGLPNGTGSAAPQSERRLHTQRTASHLSHHLAGESNMDSLS